MRPGPCTFTGLCVLPEAETLGAGAAVATRAVSAPPVVTEKAVDGYGNGPTGQRNRTESPVQAGVEEEASLLENDVGRSHSLVSNQF